jgi:predicted ArsR family transcriptional regulator
LSQNSQNGKTEETMSDNQIMQYMRQKFATYQQVTAESGPEKARETLFVGYPERQRQMMGQFILGNTLVEGFRHAIPLFAQMGMVMDVVDLSNQGQDAVLEVQRACPFLEIAKEYGVEKPCYVVCDLDVQATQQAFPGMKGAILSRIADGECVCLFKYEREQP